MVAVGLALLVILVVVILCLVRYFWLQSANEYYDTLTSAYISESEEFEPQDMQQLKQQLLEGNIFMRMHRWDKKSFIKDEELHYEMQKAYAEQVRKQEEAAGSVVDTLINL
jgi:hypothetical protein